MSFGYMGKILVVDLTRQRSQCHDLPGDIAAQVLGGKGLGAKLLAELVPTGANPLGAENALVYATGPLTGTNAPSMRGCVVTLSPLTGMFNDSYFGGHFSQELKYVGYDALVITGRAPEPVFLSINDGEAGFHPAGEIWGKDTYETYDLVRSRLNDSSYRISCIGPAGEHMVKFALVDCDPHRQAGRCGAGAVMGSKNLKAVAVRGSHPVRVKDPEAFKIAQARACAELRASQATQDLAEFSTVSVMPFSNEYGFFPVRNFTGGQYERAAELFADQHHRDVWMRHWACAGCPIHCGKMGMIRKGKYRGTICDNVEYETVGLLGGNLDISDVSALSYFNQVADRLGLDTISLGAVLSFVVEAYNRGMLSSTALEGLRPAFGALDSLLALTQLIARRQGIGHVLADGVRSAAEHIGQGSSEFAAHIQGLETPAWGPRGSYGMGLAYLTGDRGGCHQRGFPIGYETAGQWEGRQLADGHHLEDRAQVTIWEQNYLAALYSLTICEFGRSGISTSTYLDLLLAATGIRLTDAEFFRAGERIWNAIRMFNLEQGWSQDRAAMPDRFREPLPQGIMKGHRFRPGDEGQLLREYNQARGWDETGRPTEETIRRLGLPDLQARRILR
ncbi:MAG: aldehyde ferredoxin oxidoreductase family protein [Bacillota bacterium]